MIIFILLLTIAAYSYVYNAGLCSDDVQGIVSMGDNFPSKHHRGWTNAWDRILYKVLKQDKRKWHLLELGYHLLVVSLFYALGIKLFGREIAVVATMLFAIHPCTNQNVAWLSGRHYTLLGMIAVLCAYFYSNIFIASPLFMAGLLVHPLMTMFPFAMLITKPSWQAFFYIVLIAFVVRFYLKIIKSRIVNFGFKKEEARVNPKRAVYMIKMIAYYFYMAVFPLNVAFFHGKMHSFRPSMTDFNLKAGLALFSILTFGSLAVIYRQVLPAFGFGLTWFTLFLLPCINIIRSNMVFCERYMYIPLMGFTLALAQVLTLIPYYPVVLSAIVTLYFVRTFSITMAYSDEFKLYGTNLKNQPQSVEAHINLGDKYIRINRPDLALPLFQRGVELDDKNDVAWFNLGVAFHNLGDIVKSRGCWEKSLAINPSYVNPRFNLMRLEDEVKKHGGWDAVTNRQPAMVS